jgi:hypothetical protein
MNETWKPIPGFPGYEVSDMGQVKSLKRKSPRVLSPTTETKSGYSGVGLRADGKFYYKRVHQLVMLAFVGPCPANMEVLHGPGGPGDNRLCNLRYDTHLANMEEAAQSEAMVRKLTHDQVVEIRDLFAEGSKPEALAEKYGVCSATVRFITLGKTHTYLPGETFGPYEVQHQRANRIREAYTTGRYTMTELAKEYGMHLSAISLIINNKRCTPTPAPVAEAEAEVTAKC